MVEFLKYYSYTAANWVSTHTEISKRWPWCMSRVKNSFVKSQMESKLWLIEELTKVTSPKRVALLGGWYAHIITNLLIETAGAEFVKNFEIDEDAKLISCKFNREYRKRGQFSAEKCNVMFSKISPPMGYLNKFGLDPNRAPPVWAPDVKTRKINFPSGKPKIEIDFIKFDTIINTSCEHMFDMSRFREINPKYKHTLLVLQSTDNDSYVDHINCVKDENHLAEQANIVDIKYMGSKKLSNDMTRFMVIGR